MVARTLVATHVTITWREIVYPSGRNYFSRQTLYIKKDFIKMAYIDIEEVIEYLDSDIKKALEQALQNYGIKENIDRNRLFKEFVKSVRRKCSSREYVPDNLVDK